MVDFIGCNTNFFVGGKWGSGDSIGADGGIDHLSPGNLLNGLFHENYISAVL
jgi:hypothetical protein